MHMRRLLLQTLKLRPPLLPSLIALISIWMMWRE
nr:MAG TPA: hypothetical protein [Inoviridae sp.]